MELYSPFKHFTSQVRCKLLLSTCDCKCLATACLEVKLTCWAPEQKQGCTAVFNLHDVRELQRRKATGVLPGSSESGNGVRCVQRCLRGKSWKLQ